MRNFWYDVYFSCKHPIHWNEFKPVPKAHGVTWCSVCQSQVEIVAVDKHMADVSDYEEEMEYE
jgi:hypothetical protein